MATSSDADDDLLVSKLWLTSVDATFIFVNQRQLVVPPLVEPLLEVLSRNRASETMEITVNAFSVMVFRRIPLASWRTFASSTTRLVIKGNNFHGIMHDIVSAFVNVSWLECLHGINTDSLATYDLLLPFELKMLM